MISYLLIRILTYPITWLSWPAINQLGKHLGSALYYLIPKFRKRAHYNLALATSLNLSTEQIHAIAKESIQNLVITCLEYAKLEKESNIEEVASIENLPKKEGQIYFCGHQANWEILFIRGTKEREGVAIGRPIKNKYLYNWILSIRQKNGGRVVPAKNAIKEGLRAIRKGQFLGVVGDQGMPDSGYSSPFFGRRAWTTPMPALLSYKTGCPIVVATTHRENGHHLIAFSDPIYPNKEIDQEIEVDRLMREVLSIFEESVRKHPGEWLWIHNRWKQQTPHKLKKAFRYESIAIIVDEQHINEILPSLPTWKEIYPHEFITIFTPHPLDLPEGFEQIVYSSCDDLLKQSYKHKLVFNFTTHKTFKGLNTLQWEHLPNLYKTLLKPHASK